MLSPRLTLFPLKDKQHPTENIFQSAVYPMPSMLAKLVLPGETRFDNLAHPTFLSQVSTERLIKLFEFGLWAEHMVEKGNHATLSDVVKEELAIYESEGFGLRGNFQANRLSFVN